MDEAEWNILYYSSQKLMVEAECSIRFVFQKYQFFSSILLNILLKSIFNIIIIFAAIFGLNHRQMEVKE